MHLVSKHKLGLTQTSRDAFAILLEEGMLDRKLAVSLMNMVGLRSVAVHYYQSLDVNILESFIVKHLKEFLLFTQVIIELEQYGKSFRITFVKDSKRDYFSIETTVNLTNIDVQKEYQLIMASKLTIKTSKDRSCKTLC